MLCIITLTFDYQDTHFDPHTIACNLHLHLPISPHKTCNFLEHHTEEGVNWAENKANIWEIMRLVQNNQPDKLKKSFDELNKIKRI